MVASEAKIHMTTKQAYAAIFFTIFVIAVIGATNANLIKNPMSAGIIVTLTTGLILVGHFLAQKGIIAEGALPLWYMMTAGIIMILAGGILAGMIAPAFVIPGASLVEIAITSAMFYAFVIVAVASAVLTVLVYTGKLKLPSFKKGMEEETG